jgi:hypothetical protein
VATSSGVGVLNSTPAFFGFIYAGWGEAGLPPLSTGYVNGHAFAVFLLFVSARFFWSLVR